ncbi:MAG: putative ABC transport system ATP-binding protein [Alphaproteobacteria bacterium]
MDPNLFRYIWTHSRSDQIFVLILIALSLPFYWLSLDVPKRIVNEALQGEAFVNGVTEARLFSLSLPLPDWLGGTLVFSQGFLFEQINYLFALSFLFLFYVLANGAFKYAINILKGMLAERMMRRLRFELFATMMRFRPEDIRTVKPAEAASMIKDEVEPIGGFIGDAFIQPAFLSTQALTAVIFIITQSFWLGMVAVSVVLVQAFVIPYLRREQLRLGRLRQIASRRLAGRIGEMIDGARTIQTYGLKNFSEAEIGGRLGALFTIRADLYKRKFAVKYLNNILAQVTPFFFYSIGGYLALRGSLDLGQLVAVIGAYRDLPPPIKELIDWDQRRADVTIKYEQVISQFSGRELLPDESDVADDKPVPNDAPLIIRDLTVLDQRGTAQIAGASLSVPRPAHVAIVGSAGSGRDILARVIGRQTTKYEGEVKLGDRDIKSLTMRGLSREISYVPPEPELFTGSIRENVMLSLKQHPPAPGKADELRWREARRTGNPMVDGDEDWCDYQAAGVTDAASLEFAILDVLHTTGLTGDIYSYGLKGLLPADSDDALKARVVAGRHEIRATLTEAKLDRLIQPFDFTEFNPQATIGENLVFGVVAGERLAGNERTSNQFFRAILSAEALTQPLVEIGLRIAENGVEVFSDLPSGHPLFERFSMIRSSDLEFYAELFDERRNSGSDAPMADEATDKLIELALSYIEPRHRLGLVTPELETRILRARNSFKDYLPQDYANEIEFYDRDLFMAAAPIRDNLLFGRVAQNVANAEQRVADFLKESLPKLGLEELVYSLGLDYDVGPRGQALFSAQRASVSLARAMIRRPKILILEDAFKDYGDEDTVAIQDRIAERMKGATLIMTCPTNPSAGSFNQTINVDGARVTAPAQNIAQAASSVPEEAENASPASTDESAANMEAGE